MRKDNQAVAVMLGGSPSAVNRKRFYVRGVLENASQDNEAVSDSKTIHKKSHPKVY
jgi:hypothetical protein